MVILERLSVESITSVRRIVDSGHVGDHDVEDPVCCLFGGTSRATLVLPVGTRTKT